MGKISKKYIGLDQVGAAQIELENAAALKAKSADGLSSQDILEIDPSNLLQMLKHPYLPGDATSALQSIPKQQLDAAVSTLNGSISSLNTSVSTLQTDVSVLQGQMSTAIGNISTLQTDVSTLQGQMSTAQGQIATLQTDVSTLQGQMSTANANISTLQGQMSTVQGNISDLQTEDLSFVKLDGSRPMTGNLSMMPSLGVHYKITGLADPQDARDAVNKQYVDSIAEGLHVHAPAKVIINSTLESVSGGTVDYDNGASGVGATLTLSVPLTSYLGYTFQDGDRVIVNGQANAAHNGVYTVGSNGSLGSVFTRALDYNTPSEIAGGDFIFVQYGSGIANTGWVEPIGVTQVGVDPIVFVQFSGAGTYSAGDGLTLLGSEFNVNADTVTYTTEINSSNQVAVKLDPAGQLSTSSSGIAISSAFQGRMSTAESNISALQSGKANTNLDNLAAGDTSIPAGVDLRSLETDQVLGFRIFTANQASSVSGNIDLRTGTTAGFLSGRLAMLPGLNSNANAGSPTSIVTGGALIRSGTITGGTQGSTGTVVLLSGSIVSAGVAGDSGGVSIESGTVAGTGTTGIIRAVSGFNLGNGSSGNFFAGTGKSLSSASGYVSLFTGSIDAFSGMDNRSSNASTGGFYAGSGNILNPTGSNSGSTGETVIYSGEINASGATGSTGNVDLISGGHYGLGSTGLAQLQSGVIYNALSSANTGFAQIRSGDNAGSGSSGEVYIASGNNSGTGNSGNINLNVGSVVSGTRGTINLNGASVRVSSSMYFTSGGWSEIKTDNASGTTGSIGFKSGDSSSGDSGLVAIGSGDAPAGAAGNLVLFSGVGASGRGFVQIEASKLNMIGFIDMNSSKIVNLQDPTAAQDAATKAYVDSQIAAGTDYHKQAIVLSATDIANQYVDLSVQAIAQSCQIGVGQRVMLWEGLDYSVSVVGGVSRISFTGPSATGGAEELEAGQTLYIQCVIE